MLLEAASAIPASIRMVATSRPISVTSTGDPLRLYRIAVVFNRVILPQPGSPLNSDPEAVRTAVVGVRKLEEAIRQAIAINIIPRSLLAENASERVELIRVKVPQTECLLDLFKVLMIKP